MCRRCTLFDPDATYVQENPHVQHGLTLPDVAWAFTTGAAGNWRPLTWLSLMLDVTCFGVNSAAHRQVNLALHVVNTLLLFGFLRWTTARPWRSATSWCGRIVRCPPAARQSVAWVSERKDVLSTCFGFSALWAYAAYVRRPGVALYLPVFFLLAMASSSQTDVGHVSVSSLASNAWPLNRWEAVQGKRRSGGLRTTDERERDPNHTDTEAKTIDAC